MLKIWIQKLTQMVRDLIALRDHLRPNRWLVFGALATACASALFESVGIQLLIPMIAMLQGDVEKTLEGRFLSWLPKLLPNLKPEVYVGIFAGLVIVALLLKNVVLLAYQTLQVAVSQRVARNLRQSFFSFLTRVNLPAFEERKAGAMVSTFTLEIDRTRGTVETGLLFMQRVAMLALYIVVLLVISWQFTLATAVLGILMGLIGSRLQAVLARNGDERARAQIKLVEYVGQIFGGMRIVRATNMQDPSIRKFDEMGNWLSQIENRSARRMQSIGPLMEILGVIGVMALVSGAYFFLIRKGLLQVAELMVVGLVLIRLLPLVNQIYGLLGQLTFFAAGLSELREWFSLPLFPIRAFGTLKFPGIRQSIQLENLEFSYPNGKKALSGLNLEIPAGKTVALVGASGSGKSTLASLFLRLREPTGGRILVDGTDYWNFTPESWHERLGVVDQEAFLFNDTIRNNIRFGCPEATEQDLKEAVKAAHLESVIQDLKEGLDTVVGERGAMLSGGQRQRITIARALLRKPQLILLDEATSALDNYSERQVQEALDEARKGRTTIVIAHRLSTIRNADLIVVLDEGRIIETGTWQQLERLGGNFSRLLKLSGIEDRTPAEA